MGKQGRNKLSRLRHCFPHWIALLAIVLFGWLGASPTESFAVEPTGLSAPKSTQESGPVVPCDENEEREDGENEKEKEKDDFDDRFDDALRDEFVDLQTLATVRAPHTTIYGDRHASHDSTEAHAPRGPPNH